MASILAFPTCFAQPVKQNKRRGRLPKTVASISKASFEKWRVKRAEEERQRLIDKQNEHRLFHIGAATYCNKRILELLSEQHN